MNEKLIKAEFHVHSIYSKDSLVAIDKLLAAARKKGLNKLAITDHNEIKGAQLAKELDPEMIIIGEEIMTSEGEILGYFLNNHIISGLSPMKTIEELKKQDAFISIPHPFDHQRGRPWRPGSLERILPFIDALEVFNPRCLSKKYNDFAFRVAEEKNLAKIVGSDAHSLIELGRAMMTLPNFDDADGLRAALPLATYKQKLSGIWVRVLSRFASWYKRIN